MSLNKRTGFLPLVAALLLFWCAVLPAAAQSAGYSKTTLHFGDQTNWRPAPTSGTITGVCKTQGPWVQTGPIVCNACRLYFGSSVTINNTITVTAGFEGNSHLNAEGPLGFGAINSGSGGSHGGLGGLGGSGNQGPGYPYQFFPLAGGAGSVGTGYGGDGGGGFYIEAAGPVTLTSSANINANGGNQFGTNAGGGAGGGVDIRTLSTLTLNSGATISANGGSGGGGGGGGGVVNLEALGGLTNNGTITVSGGTGGTNPGAAGVIYSNSYFEGPRLGF